MQLLEVCAFSLKDFYEIHVMLTFQFLTHDISTFQNVNRFIV